MIYKTTKTYYDSHGLVKRMEKTFSHRSTEAMDLSYKDSFLKMTRNKKDVV